MHHQFVLLWMVAFLRLLEALCTWTETDSLKCTSLSINELEQTFSTRYNTSDIKYFTCVKCNLTDLKLNIFSDSITTIKLPHSHIQHIDISNLIHLENLDLSNNEINEVTSGTFKNFTSLKRLRLYYNKISGFNESGPKSLFPSSLLYLDLSHNNIQIIEHDVFANLEQLQELYIHNNNLQTLGKDVFKDLKKLTTLQIFPNSITNLPSGIFKGLAALEGLYLSYGELKRLPLLQNMPKVEKIYAQYNQIAKLWNGSFETLTSLKEINLEKNKIEEIEAKVFINLPKLIRLDLSGNKLRTLSTGTFNDLISLEFLLLYDNQLTEIQADLFNGLFNLNWVNLAGNKIKDVNSDTLSNFLTKGISFQNNLIENLKGDTFKNLKPLKEINLGGNLITELPKDIFCNLTALKYLDLSSNKIIALNEHIFDELHSLVIINLQNNHLNVNNEKKHFQHLNATVLKL